MLKRIASEYAYLTGALRTLGKVKPLARHPTRTIGDLVEDLAGRYGDKPAIVADREEFTFVQYDRRANQYARWAMTNGLKKGDVGRAPDAEPSGISSPSGSASPAPAA